MRSESEAETHAESGEGNPLVLALYCLLMFGVGAVADATGACWYGWQSGGCAEAASQAKEECQAQTLREARAYGDVRV